MLDINFTQKQRKFFCLFKFCFAFAWRFFLNQEIIQWNVHLNQVTCIFAEGGEKLCSEFIRILPTNTNCNMTKARQMNANPVSSHQEYLLPDCKKKGTDELAAWVSRNYSTDSKEA